jgi:hypothetical protein
MFAVAAVLIGGMLYIGYRQKMKIGLSNQSPNNWNVEPTNFHQETSVSRPIGGKYYAPKYNVYKN